MALVRKAGLPEMVLPEKGDDEDRRGGWRDVAEEFCALRGVAKGVTESEVAIAPGGVIMRIRELEREPRLS